MECPLRSFVLSWSSSLWTRRVGIVSSALMLHGHMAPCERLRQDGRDSGLTWGDFILDVVVTSTSSQATIVFNTLHDNTSWNQSHAKCALVLNILAV